MSRAAGLQIPFELAFSHRVLFGVELLDAVTLQRVHRGIKVVAVGLKNDPYVNDQGLFVWRPEDASKLEKITIDPGLRPFEPIEIPKADMQFPPLKKEHPLKPQELSPTVNYPFVLGTTGIIGTLVEAKVADPVPVVGADVRLQWLDDSSSTGAWKDAPTVSHTNDKGDFAAVLRLDRTLVPKPVPSSNDISVRLQFTRDANQRHSTPQDIPIGRVTRPTPTEKLIFAWQDLNP